MAMRVTGKVKNGVVELPPGAHFEEGQRVEIIPARMPPEKAGVLHETGLAFATARDLPDDLAINHDYYLHGQSKQQPRRGRWLPTGKPAPELTEREVAEFTDKLLALAAETSNLPTDLSAN